MSSRRPLAVITGALLGMDVRIAAPRELWPPDDVVY
jgi:ornithine carbamoyltransferase